MHRYYLQLLVALVSCVSLTQKAWCETTVDEEPSTPPEKGKFYQTHVFGERPRGCSVVYSADASAMSSTWKSSDFRLLNDVYTTGTYFENKIYSAESPTIHIPTVTYSDRLFVCLEEMFEVENFYDYVSVEASTDFGKTWNKIYGRSGYTDGFVYDYTQIVGYSNKDVKFRLNLVSDSSYIALGFSLKNFEILLWQYDNYVTSSQLRGSTVDPVDEGKTDVDVKTPKLNKIKIQDVVWEDKDEGVISFYAEDENGKFVPDDNINLNDIKVVIKKGETEIKKIEKKPSCFSWEKNTPKVDIALVVDFSISMQDPITKMENALFNMCDNIASTYDAMFSLARFGCQPGGGPMTVKENFILCSEGEEEGEEEEEGKIYLFKRNSLNSLIDPTYAVGSAEYVYHAIDVVSHQTFFRPNATKVMIILYNMQGPSDFSLYNKKAEDGKLSSTNGIYTREDIKSFLTDFLSYGILKNDHDGKDSIFARFDFCNDNVFYDKENTAFDEIFTNLGNVLLKRNYLKISPECLNSLECDNEYNVTLEIIPGQKEDEGVSDHSTTIYSYPGYITRHEVKKYDYVCLNTNQLTIDFSVSFGCSNKALENPVVYYGYGNKCNKKVVAGSPDENGIYHVTLDVQEGDRLNYRIEQSLSNGESTIVSPIQYSNLNPYWTVHLCPNGESYSITPFNNPVFSKCKKEGNNDFSLSVSLNIDEKQEHYVTYLFYSSSQNEHISEWKSIMLESEDGMNFNADFLPHSETAEEIRYFLVYRDTVNKMEYHYGNGNDDFQKAKISEFNDMLCPGEDPCNNIQLSSHILEEDNDLLSFDVYRENTNVEIFLCDTLGNKIKSKKVDDVNVGNKEINLISFLSLNDLIIDGKKIKLSYTRPYILALKINEKVSYMYVYLGRKKKQN
jgi:hypothetical protein